MNFGSLFQSGDWKGEKHVPVIHAPEIVKKGECFKIKVLVGEEIPHPNTFEHYIGWIKVFFKPEDGKFPIEVASGEFKAHGESLVFTEPLVKAKLKIEASGTLYAISYCNIHGLWENCQEIKVEE